MFVLKFVIFMICISLHHCRLPDKVYCVNPQCDEPISKAKTLLNYNSGDNDLMSFRANREALVFMKSAGSNADLWYASIDGKSGFVGSKFLRELKVFVKDPQHVLPVQIKKKENNVQPDKVQQPHEVFEGTTIYSTEQPNNNQPTEAPVPASNDVTTPELSNISPLPKELNTLPSTVTTDNEIGMQQNLNSELNAENIQDLTKSTTTPVPIEAPIPESVLHDATTPSPEISYTPENDSTTQPDKVPEEQSNVSTEAPETLTQPEPLVNIETQNTATSGEPEPVDNVNNVPTISQNEKVEIMVEELDQSKVTSDPVDHLSTPTEPDLLLTESIPIPTDSPQSQLSQGSQSMSSSSGDVISSETIKVPENNLLQEPLSQSVADNTEQNSSANSISNNIDTDLPQYSNTVPEISVSNPPEVNPIQVPITQQYDNGMFGSEFNEGGLSDNANGVPIQEQVTQETIPETNVPDFINENVQEFAEKSDVIDPVSSNDETIAPLNNNDPIEHTTSEESVTTPSPYDYYSTDYSESLAGDIYDTPTTETPTTDQENSEGFLSNMFSSMSDMWPSTKEPPMVDNLFKEAEAETEEVVSNTDSEESFSFLSYFWNSYTSVMGTKEEVKALFPSTGQTCFTDEYCDGNATEQNNRLLTFLLTTAMSVLLFILGYYYIDNRRQDSKLIGNINSLQRDLLFTTKECEILKEDLTTTKNKLTGIEDSSFGMDDMVQSLKEEIKELNAQNDRLRNSLDDNEKLLRVSENTAGELQNTLGEVENTLSELLAERSNTEDQLAELNGKIEAFEEELISVSRERDNFQLKYVSAESALEEAKKLIKQLEEINEKLKDANNTVELQTHEITALKDALRELKSGDSSNVDVTSLIDHTEIKAKLAKALKDKAVFETKFEREQQERSRLAGELAASEEAAGASVRRAAEATTRLDVLGKYFQERESELLKELSAKESIYLSKQGESASTVEKMDLLQQEIQRYKEKCEALTLELAEQESRRLTAESSSAARAHEAWLEARAARRDADAAHADAAALRRRLAALTASAGVGVDGAQSPHRLVSSPLAPEALPPPLPPMFLPPLPPPPRPPPLGRLPSPHPPHPQRYGERRYSPDSRYSPGSRYSPETRYSPESRYSRSPDARYSPRPRPRRRDSRSPTPPPARRRSRDRYSGGRGSRSRVGPPETETEYNSDSPTPRRRRYDRRSGPSSGSGCSSESDK